MGFGFARRRRDELESAPGSDAALPGAASLARFAYVEVESDEGLEEHEHDGPCNCGLRGE